MQRDLFLFRHGKLCRIIGVRTLHSHWLWEAVSSVLFFFLLHALIRQQNNFLLFISFQFSITNIIDVYLCVTVVMLLLLQICLLPVDC